MNITEMLEIIRQYYSLKEVDAGEFGSFTVNHMDFDVHTYDAEGLGCVSTMYAEGMAGQMKMTTVIINPFEADAPLLSIDRIYAMGSDILYLEPFDTTLSHQFDVTDLKKVIADHKDIPDLEVKENWYDPMRIDATAFKKDQAENAGKTDAFIKEYLETFVKQLGTCAKIEDPSLKKAKAAEYSDGLIKNGGPSTDVFKKEFGDEKTGRYFREVLFGTGR